jgi:hypothetical protein
MHAQRKLVSFIGIGGEGVTDLLYSYLKTHPEVSVLEEESNFFGSAEIYSRGVDWYEHQFKQSSSKQFQYGELATKYLHNAQTAALIVRTYPSAKLLAVIDNPLVMVKLAYVEARHSGQISPKTTVAMFIKQHPEVLLNARFGRQLAQYFSYYAPTDLLVLLASDIENNPLSAIKQTFKHLCINPDFIPVTLKHLVVEDEENPKKKPGFIKRGFRYIKKLIVSVIHFASRIFNPPETGIGAGVVVARKLTLSPELEQYLKEYFRQDVAMLSDLVHRNLSAEWDIN